MSAWPGNRLLEAFGEGPWEGPERTSLSGEGPRRTETEKRAGPPPFPLRPGLGGLRYTFSRDRDPSTRIFDRSAWPRARRGRDPDRRRGDAAPILGRQSAHRRGVGADVSAARGRALDEGRLLELRDEVAVAKPEDLPALFEQMHHLGALQAQRGRSISGSIDGASPYFGHMRLEETVPVSERRGHASSVRRRDVLIGSRSYVDSGAGIRIVDWRHAPVSRIYYRYGEGDGYEEQLGDRIVEGEVVLRRSVSIVRGELFRVSAPQGTFVRSREGRWKRIPTHRSRLETEAKWGGQSGSVARPADAAWAPRLGVGFDGQVRQDKHLPAIAAMLDEKQFELIAQESSGLVAIQGSAGSGKTTVGLHRIAYLAYRDPQRFRPDRMLVVVPNEALIHYVDRVLPSLGVEDVRVTDLRAFARRVSSKPSLSRSSPPKRTDGDAPGRVAGKVPPRDASGHRADRARDGAPGRCSHPCGHGQVAARRSSRHGMGVDGGRWRGARYEGIAPRALAGWKAHIAQHGGRIESAGRDA